MTDKITELDDVGDEELFSDSTDAKVFIPYNCQVDGRKREAKRLKSRTKIAQEEVELDQLVRDYQNGNRKIRDLEQELSDLRTQNITKRELQSQRNRLTA